MMTKRVRAVVGGLAAALLMAQVAVGPNASAGASVSQQMPQSIWNFNGQTGLELIGSWAAMVNDPEAGVGQSAPDWHYEHVFAFTGSNSFGSISLDKVGGDKLATLTLVDQDGEMGTKTEQIAYDWQIERFYFPFVLLLPGGVLGGWVYDFANDSFTFIGVVTFPTSWGALHPASVTQTAWGGSDLPSCSAYSRSEHFRHPPTGIAGGQVVNATHVLDNTTVGDCPAGINSAVSPWKLYTAGENAAATTTTTEATTTTTEATTTTTEATTTTTEATTTTTEATTTTTEATTTTTEATTTTTAAAEGLIDNLGTLLG